MYPDVSREQIICFNPHFQNIWLKERLEMKLKHYFPFEINKIIFKRTTSQSILTRTVNDGTKSETVLVQLETFIIKI